MSPATSDVVDALLDAGAYLAKEPYNHDRMASGERDVKAALKKRHQ